MKIATKLLMVVASVALGVGMSSAPLAAHASDGDIDTAVIVGVCQLSPGPLLGGTGTFSCSHNGVCTSSDTIPPEVFTCTHVESGSYQNEACGTMSWSGSASTSESDGTFESATFSAVFVGGVGVFSGGLTGVVDLLPTTAPSPSSCSTQYEAAGELNSIL